MKKNNSNKNIKAFTLLELLLVIVIIAILTATAAPYFSNAASEANDGTAEQMVINLLASAKSMGIAGRVKESSITFKPDGSIKIGDNFYKLPPNFTFNITSDKSFTFELNGTVTPSNDSIIIKRNGFSKSIAVK